MLLTDADLQKLLVDQSYLTADDVKRAEEHAKTNNIGLKQAMFDLGLLTEDLYEAALAEQSHLPFFSIEKTPPKADVVTQLPEDIARTYEAALVEQTPDAVTIATSDPTRPLLEEAIRLNVGQAAAVFPEKEEARKSSRKSASRFSFGRPKEEERKPFAGNVQFVFAPRRAIESLFQFYRKPLATRFQQIIDAQRRVAPEILEEIFQDAINLKSSDIHFEPQEKTVVVRFRIDGVLHETGRIPKEYYEGVVNRVKIAANMHIDEHLSAQDGAIRYSTGKDTTMDVRVSIVPIVDGEKIVMRLLSEYVRTLTLQDLGFSARNRAVLEQASYKPFGMILTTGPTGSGKSTTLYALMKLRNHPDVNISTIEDPVEYKVPGINHIQVNTETDLTFSKGLRALMRQDPNIILVGEIRDGETASIAVNAALTGHLLFSTLHSNDAATAVPRLLEMGVEPFLLASTLEVIIAQRLVRRICPRCRYSFSVPRKEIDEMFEGAPTYFPGKGPVSLYRGKGCDACGGIGYQGRVGVHELIEVTQEIEDLIVARKSSADIEACARKQGMQTIFEDAIEKAKAGVTTVEEVLRVSTPPDAHGK